MEHEINGHQTAAKDFLNLASEGIEVAVGHYSAQSLAYLGDAVFEVLVRGGVLAKGNLRVGELNQRALKLVKATAQSKMYHKLMPLLDGDEAAVMKRGRNAVSHSRAKSASVSEYRHATGVEALFGYLFIIGKADRIVELFSLCGDFINKE